MSLYTLLLLVSQALLLANCEFHPVFLLSWKYPLLALILPRLVNVITYSRQTVACLLVMLAGGLIHIVRKPWFYIPVHFHQLKERLVMWWALLWPHTRLLLPSFLTRCCRFWTHDFEMMIFALRLIQLINRWSGGVTGPSKCYVSFLSGRYLALNMGLVQKPLGREPEMMPSH